MGDPREEIRRMVETVEGDDGPDDLPGEIVVDSAADMAVVRECAALDQSDTDNAMRFVAHFGQDVVVVATDASEGGDPVVWNGRHWSHADGAALQSKLAQKLGPRIAMESEFLKPSETEAEALVALEKLDEHDESLRAKRIRKKAASFNARKRARWAFGISSKNSSRIKSFLALAAPHLRKAARDFNPDPLSFACASHTIRFQREADPENPDPKTTRFVWVAKAERGHRREDLITGFAPVDYDARAECPKFLGFLARTQPDREQQRTLQMYSGAGLLARLEQRIAYHYGNGANGKSVFLHVLSSVVGETQYVNLPKETIMGQGERGAGQASPDLIRLLWRRMLVVAELKDNEELREDVVKRLTGGDPMAVRGLYEGYIEFESVATPHMSGNGLPTIKGMDNGIWRRVFTVPWTETIPEPERRDFKEFCADLLTERAGILNWLIDGVCDYLQHGLYIAPSCKAATKEYRAEMDPIGEFYTGALVKMSAGRIRASDLWAAYIAWAKANGRTEFGATKFGRAIKAKGLAMEETGGFRWYLGVALSPELRALVDGREDGRGGDDAFG